MDEINQILNDESNNDKQMIKELSTYIKNHRDKGLPINKKFVKDIVGIIAQNSEFEYGPIYFINDSDCIACISNSIDNTLKFNMTKMMHWAQAIREGYKWKLADNRIIDYHYVLSTIIHELTHARQYYLKDNKGFEMYRTFFDGVSDDMYDGNELKFLMERYAEIRGNEIAFQVLSYVYPLEKVKEIQSMTLLYLLLGYNYSCNPDNPSEETITSAIETHNSIMQENELSEVDITLKENMTLYDRIYLGLPITMDEYSDMCDLYYYLPIKTGPIKQLINEHCQKK